MNNEQCSHYHDLYHDLACMVICTAGCCFVIVIVMMITTKITMSDRNTHAHKIAYVMNFKSQIFNDNWSRRVETRRN